MRTMTKPFFDIQKKVILVTGAAGHLGSAIVKRLHKAGAYIYINGRNEEKLSNLINDIEPSSNQLYALPFDISDEKMRRKALEIIKSQHGYLDGLVNNAYAPLAGSVYEATYEDFQTSLGTNVSATFALSQDCLPLLKKSKESPSSTIVNIASMYGMVSPDPSIYGASGMNNPPFYGASKAAIIQLTRYLAAHVIQDNIRTNAVSPGPFPPEDIKNSMPEFHQELCKKTPMNRIGHANEVAAVVHFLISNDSSYINGANLPVDGGWTAW